MIVTATEFKARCLQLLDRVKMTGERIQVTKRGKVVAELGPAEDHAKAPAKPGFAKGRLRITGDILSPLEEPWDALR
ncbi:MAG: type II toxin-antitoxin system prevent-host-death family antitoxin [Armatimonadetes bacterium]|nr:type II toxin-antitoxin system prevent-host-death family antitoxin [Armatimonadota bacterium]